MVNWTQATPAGVQILLESCKGRGGRENEAGVALMPADLEAGFFEVTGTHGAMIAQCVRRCPDAVLAFQIHHLVKNRGTPEETQEAVSWMVRFNIKALRTSRLASILVTEETFQSRMAGKEAEDD